MKHSELFWMMTSTGGVWMNRHYASFGHHPFYRVYLRNEVALIYGIMDDFGTLVKVQPMGLADKPSIAEIYEAFQ